MEWLVTLVTALALLVLLSPLLALLVTVFVLVPLALLAPTAPVITRTTFDCPFSKRKVSVEFQTSPDAEQPTDVLACSLFSDGKIRCEKGCLGLAATGWVRSQMVPRYALPRPAKDPILGRIADGAHFGRR